MTCNEIQMLIPSYIRKELDGDDRVRIKSHLRSCVTCRKNYLFHLKLYYTIDRESVLMAQPVVDTNFTEELVEQIDQIESGKNLYQKKWIWYAAAAILVAGILIGRFTINLGNDNDITNAEYGTFSQLIDSEDWSRMEIVLSDQKEFSKYASDKISIQILLDKLTSLQNKGIQYIPISGFSVDSAKQEGKSMQHSPKIEISVDDFIQILQKVKQQRSQITLEDVSSILTKI